MHEPKESEYHAGELKSHEYEAGKFFEFGGQKLLLKGTSGTLKEPSRTAEGRPMRHDVLSGGQTNESEYHAGMLKSHEYEAGEFFEFGGQKLVVKGTSGPPKERSRTAEVRPIRHDVVISSRTIPARETSGGRQIETRTAVGQPVQHRPDPQNAASELTGSGQLIGEPVRRA